MTDRVRYGFFAALLGVLGVALSVLGFLAARNPAAARLVGSADGLASLVTGLTFTAVACAVVLHYGRRSAQLATAYHDLHRATLQRERSEAALRESERFTRATLDAMDAQIAVLDADGVVMAVNRAWRSRPHPLLAAAGECDVGSNYLTLCDGVTDVGAAEAARVAAAIRAITSGERDDCLLESHVHVDGRLVVTRVTRFAGKGPLRLVVAHQDVTALAHPPEDRAPEPPAEPLADLSPIGLFRTDASGALVQANAHLLALGGMDLDRALGSGWLHLVHPDDRDRTVAEWQRLVDARASGEATFRIVGHDRAVRTCLLRAIAVDGGWVGTLVDGVPAADPDADDRREAAAAALARQADLARQVDDLVRERDRAATALRAAEAERTRMAEELARLYDEAPCGYHALDADGTIVAVNETACGWLGRRRTALVGERRFADLLAPESAARLADALQGLDRDGAERDLDLDVVRKDGAKVVLAARLSAVRDAAGRPAGSRATLVDVTERRRAGERIAALEQTLAERDAALVAADGRLVEANGRLADTTRRLDEATQRLADATRELESFSRSVSHELEVPLRAIDGVAKRLTEEHAARPDAGDRGHLGALRESAGGMARLLEGLASLSRLRRRPLERASVDMAAVARDVVDEVRAGHPERDVAVSIEGVAPADGDAPLIRQLLARLVDDAFRRTAGVPHPYVDLGSVATDGGPVYYVRDNGRGFDPGGAAGDGADPDEDGIGLALVGRIVEQHGGRIWAEGRPDDGATVFFTLGTAPPSDESLPTLPLGSA